jgi:hypothetical protein
MITIKHRKVMTFEEVEALFANNDEFSVAHTQEPNTVIIRMVVKDMPEDTAQVPVFKPTVPKIFDAVIHLTEIRYIYQNH